jgi:hypothetical protein
MVCSNVNFTFTFTLPSDLNEVNKLMCKQMLSRRTSKQIVGRLVGKTLNVEHWTVREYAIGHPTEY